jgi:hypothetical protein
VRKRLIVSGVAGAAAVGVLAAVLWMSVGPGAGPTGPLGDGPLGTAGPADATQCVQRQATTVGMSDLQNTTSSPIQIEKFSLVGPHAVRLLSVYLAPVVRQADGTTIILGAGSAYPPTPDDLVRTDVQWDARHALPMTMAPDRAGHSWNIIFGLERTAADGSVGYYQVQYEWRGKQYIWTSDLSVRLVTGRCT